MNNYPSCKSLENENIKKLTQHLNDIYATTDSNKIVHAYETLTTNRFTPIYCITECKCLFDQYTQSIELFDDLGFYVFEINLRQSKYPNRVQMTTGEKTVSYNHHTALLLYDQNDACYFIIDPILQKMKNNIKIHTALTPSKWVKHFTNIENNHFSIRHINSFLCSDEE
ncbi:hypothetical protein MRY82_06630 [bacterium]|nr:hypothetical protein [bacterium]